MGDGIKAAPRTRRFYEALEWVRNSHAESQKYNGYPYLFHVLSVADIALAHGACEDIQIACLLHDAIEDTRRSYDDVARKFGGVIAYWVSEVTGDQRLAKTEQYDNLLARAHSIDPSSLWVKLCDLHANFSCVVGVPQVSARWRSWVTDSLEFGLSILDLWRRREDLGECVHDHIQEVRELVLTLAETEPAGGAKS